MKEKARSATVGGRTGRASAREKAGAALARASQGIRLVREQCYVCWMSAPETPVEPPVPIEKLRLAHHRYFVDLERKGILFAAGPFMDEKGKRHGLGMMIIRARSLVQAQRIAGREPYTRLGMRIMTVTPWQLNEGSLRLCVRFADGRLDIDGRSWALEGEDR